MVHLAFFAPYCTTPHTQRSCLYSRAARTNDLLSGSTQSLTVFGFVHIQIAHSENTHKSCMAELGSIQYERAEPRLSPPVIHADLAPATAWERPYTKVQVLTTPLVDPSARGWVLRYVSNVQDYVTRGFTACGTWLIIMQGTLRRCVALAGSLNSSSRANLEILSSNLVWFGSVAVI